MVCEVELILDHKQAARLVSQFQKVEIINVRRSANARAHALVVLISFLTVPTRENLNIGVLKRRPLPHFEGC